MKIQPNIYFLLSFQMSHSARKPYGKRGRQVTGPPPKGQYHRITKGFVARVADAGFGGTKTDKLRSGYGAFSEASGISTKKLKRNFPAKRAETYKAWAMRVGPAIRSHSKQLVKHGEKMGREGYGIGEGAGYEQGAGEGRRVGKAEGLAKGIGYVKRGVRGGFEEERERRVGEQRAFATKHGPRPNDPLKHDPLYSGIYSNMRSQIGASEEQSGQYAARKMEEVRNYIQTGQGGNDEATQRYLQWLGPLGGSPYKDSLKFAEAGMGSIDGARNNAGFGALNGPRLNLELCGPTDFYRGPKTLQNFFSWQDPVNTLSRRTGRRFPLNDFGFDNSGYTSPAVGSQQDDPQSLIEMSQRQQAYLGRIQSSTEGGGAERLLNGVTLQGLGGNYKPLAGGM